MTPKLITLDAAGTLVNVRWSPALLARQCIENLDLPLDADESSQRFSAMLRSRWAAYSEVNMLRSEVEGDLFWHRLCADWLVDRNVPSEKLETLVAEVWRLLYGADQSFFSLYTDVVPALDRLKQTGIPLAVISNWDYSLHRILRMLGIYDWFDYVIASLEEGFEKPDPRIFQLALDRFGIEACDALHVGDDARDDHGGAQSIGMRSLLIDRSRHNPEAPYIASLMDIRESAAWTN